MWTCTLSDLNFIQGFWLVHPLHASVHTRVRRWTPALNWNIIHSFMSSLKHTISQTCKIATPGLETPYTHPHACAQTLECSRSLSLSYTNLLTHACMLTCTCTHAHTHTHTRMHRHTKSESLCLSLSLSFPIIKYISKCMLLLTVTHLLTEPLTVNHSLTDPHYERECALACMNRGHLHTERGRQSHSLIHQRLAHSLTCVSIFKPIRFLGPRQHAWPTSSFSRTYCSTSTRARSFSLTGFSHTEAEGMCQEPLSGLICMPNFQAPGAYSQSQSVIWTLALDVKYY